MDQYEGALTQLLECFDSVLLSVNITSTAWLRNKIGSFGPYRNMSFIGPYHTWNPLWLSLRKTIKLRLYESGGCNRLNRAI